MFGKSHKITDTDMQSVWLTTASCLRNFHEKMKLKSGDSNRWVGVKSRFGIY